MKKKISGSAFALIILAVAMPARAEVIADQSRLSVSSPLSPSLEQVVNVPGKQQLLN